MVNGKNSITKINDQEKWYYYGKCQKSITLVNVQKHGIAIQKDIALVNVQKTKYY